MRACTHIVTFELSRSGKSWKRGRCPSSSCRPYPRLARLSDLALVSHIAANPTCVRSRLHVIPLLAYAIRRSDVHLSGASLVFLSINFYMESWLAVNRSIRPTQIGKVLGLVHLPLWSRSNRPLKACHVDRAETGDVPPIVVSYTAKRGLACKRSALDSEGNVMYRVRCGLSEDAVLYRGWRHSVLNALIRTWHKPCISSMHGDYRTRAGQRLVARRRNLTDAGSLTASSLTPCNRWRCSQRQWRWLDAATVRAMKHMQQRKCRRF